MTNAELLKSKLTLGDLVRLIETENCRKCKARKICKKKYPDGVWAGFDCKSLLREWLKQEAPED